MRATVTSKGQVTIPREIRKIAHISEGTQLDFQILNDGTLAVRPLKHDISTLKGIVSRKGRRPVSLKAMEKAIEKGLEESMA